MKKKCLLSLLIIALLVLSFPGTSVFAAKYGRIQDVPGYHLQNNPQNRSLPYVESIDFMYYKQDHSQPSGFTQITWLNVVMYDVHYRDEETGIDYCVFSESRKANLMNNGYKISVNAIDLCLPEYERREGYRFLGYNTDPNATTGMKYFTDNDYGKKFYQIFVKDDSPTSATTYPQTSATHDPYNPTSAATTTSQSESTQTVYHNNGSIAVNPLTGDVFTENDIRINRDRIDGNDALLAIEKAGTDPDNSVVYDINITDPGLNRLAIIPGESISVSIPIPDNVNRNADFSLYHIRSDGRAERIAVRVDGDSIVFEGKEFSPYILTWSDNAAEQTTAPFTLSGGIIIAIAGAVLLTAGLLFCAILYKRQSR